MKRTPGSPFVDGRLPFYRLHARQWLLIALARASTEFPDVLAPFADQFVNLALHDQPHVMIRKFASLVAVALVENGVLSGENLRERLTSVNVSSLPVVESKSFGRVSRDTSDVAGKRTKTGTILESISGLTGTNPSVRFSPCRRAMSRERRSA